MKYLVILIILAACTYQEYPTYEPADDYVQENFLADIMSKNQETKIKTCKLEDLKAKEEIYEGNYNPIIFLTDKGNILLFEGHDNDSVEVYYETLTEENQRVLNLITNELR